MRRGSGLPVDLPPTKFGFVIDDLMEVGPAEAAGMGQAPVSWQALDAWQRLTGRQLPSWRLLLLRRLSSDWAVESSHGDDPHRAAPWQRPLTRAEIEASESVHRALFGHG